MFRILQLYISTTLYLLCTLYTLTSFTKKKNPEDSRECVRNQIIYMTMMNIRTGNLNADFVLIILSPFIPYR